MISPRALGRARRSSSSASAGGASAAAPAARRAKPAAAGARGESGRCLGRDSAHRKTEPTPFPTLRSSSPCGRTDHGAASALPRLVPGRRPYPASSPPAPEWLPDISWGVRPEASSAPLASRSACPRGPAEARLGRASRITRSSRAGGARARLTKLPAPRVRSTSRPSHSSCLGAPWSVPRETAPRSPQPCARRSDRPRHGPRPEGRDVGASESDRGGGQSQRPPRSPLRSCRAANRSREGPPRHGPTVEKSRLAPPRARVTRACAPRPSP